MTSDRSIQQDILAELDWEPSVNSAHIGVAVDQGVATLSGHVASYAEKRAAEQAAARVKGVKAVAVAVEVHLPAAKKRADDEIAQRVVRLLEWDERVPSDRIGVTVEHGVVTLTGSVDWRYQREAAEHDVHKLTGVVAIRNLLVVDTGAQPAVVHDQIDRAFKRTAELDAKGIAVSAAGHRVVLRGTVHSSHERHMAVRAAWSAPGVMEVDDQLVLH